jgi:hypothetical protein
VRRVRQVDLGERIVLVQQGVGALAILGERDAARIRSARSIERAAGVAIRGRRAVRKAVMKELSGGTLTWASSDSKPCALTLAMVTLLLSWLNTRCLPSAE